MDRQDLDKLRKRVRGLKIDDDNMHARIDVLFKKRSELQEQLKEVKQLIEQLKTLLDDHSKHAVQIKCKAAKQDEGDEANNNINK